MDALALLCNLLAEGPATLRVLHREGVRTLSDIETQSPERLASILGVSSAGARRFAGEARMLAARMGTTPLEREQDVPLVAAHPPADWPTLAHEERRAVESPQTAPAPWTMPVPGTLLRPGLVEGLDAALCDRFAGQKILTLEALAAASGLRLARRLGIGLARLLDLAYLARSRLAGAGTVSAPVEIRGEHENPEPAFVLRPQRPARPEMPSRVSLFAGRRGRDEDVAGPFV